MSDAATTEHAAGAPIDPQKAVDYLLSHAKTYAQAKADRVHLEQFRKSKKALLMNECDASSVAAREQYAYSHPDYIALLEGMREATRIEVALEWRLKGAQMRVEVWRSMNANDRAHERTMR